MDVTISGCSFNGSYSNKSNANGGAVNILHNDAFGLSNVYPNASLTVIDSTFRNCQTNTGTSFGGAICNPRARKVRAACAECPKERLLLETDAPDFLPQGAPPYPAENGTPLNHPGNLPLVARAAAGLRGEDPDALDAAVAETVARLFGRLFGRTVS